ncbi:MAG: 1,2-phenylacetyl-CoA epoxidase subunit PaaD [Bacteroidia bacterium]|nr:phenylacetate-CoA oxygenase subunit PaaJ [Bacteroidia bacterium]MDW8134564.1 1,2-phenylacetyl-CoA epoxidase subunit PaaD [Bacteroidia bacterium]
MLPSTDEIKRWLKNIPDPEIPHVSVVDMGMVGDIRVEEKEICIELIPTYAGCPAISLLKEQIQRTLEQHGWKSVVEINYTKPWQPQNVTPQGWEGLRRAGFALPKDFSGDPLALLSHTACPRCESEAVSLLSPFGPTACRAIFRCHTCGETFELFKPPS